MTPHPQHGGDGGHERANHAAMLQERPPVSRDRCSSESVLQEFATCGMSANFTARTHSRVRHGSEPAVECRRWRESRGDRRRSAGEDAHVVTPPIKVARRKESGWAAARQSAARGCGGRPGEPHRIVSKTSGAATGGIDSRRPWGRGLDVPPVSSDSGWWRWCRRRRVGRDGGRQIEADKSRRTNRGGWRRSRGPFSGPGTRRGFRLRVHGPHAIHDLRGGPLKPAGDCPGEGRRG